MALVNYVIYPKLRNFAIRERTGELRSLFTVRMGYGIQLPLELETPSSVLCPCESTPVSLAFSLFDELRLRVSSVGRWVNCIFVWFLVRPDNGI